MTWSFWDRLLDALRSSSRIERGPEPPLGEEVVPIGPVLAEPTEEVLAPFVGPIEELPHTRAEVYRVFGNPGTNKVDARWERANMVKALNLSGGWNNGGGRLYVHRLAEPYLREALRRAALLSSLDYIQNLGCFSFRHQRHDPSRPLSYHSWGIAVDINPTTNAGWYVKAPPEPFTPAWFEKYPRGVPADLVRAFESCGWRWGGRWKGYVDPMHFELTA